MSQLGVAVSSPALSAQLTDTSGNPSESFYRGHMAAVRREWRQQFGHRAVATPETTVSEMRSIEARVRKSLYP